MVAQKPWRVVTINPKKKNGYGEYEMLILQILEHVHERYPSSKWYFMPEYLIFDRHKTELYNKWGGGNNNPEDTFLEHDEVFEILREVVQIVDCEIYIYFKENNINVDTDDYDIEISVIDGWYLDVVFRQGTVDDAVLIGFDEEDPKNWKLN